MAVSCWAIGSTVSARLHGVKHFFSIKRNLDSAQKIYEVLAARHPYFFEVLAARKTYLITARSRKNKRAARMLESARKDHSIPLLRSLLECQASRTKILYDNMHLVFKMAETRPVSWSNSFVCSAILVSNTNLLFLRVSAGKIILKWRLFTG